LARQSTGLSQALGIRPAELHPPLKTQATILSSASVRDSWPTGSARARCHWHSASTCRTITTEIFSEPAIFIDPPETCKRGTQSAD
ncbi:MAG: hypothetical protein KGQ32_05500, partial [Xanthomonadaceae bacterium]|nr:hypothetical protein [Xanthomonadaceae bacterium]